MNPSKRPIGQIVMVAAAAVVVVFFTLRGKVREWLSPYPAVALPAAAAQEEWIYQCPMDGAILDRPGPCPKCGMPLGDANRVRCGAAPGVALTDGQIRAIGLRTAPVGRRPLTREIRALGSIEVNAIRTAAVAARVAGRVEELFTGY